MNAAWIAWNAGQNINDALTAAGYALEVRNWVIDQFTGQQSSPAAPSQLVEEEMSPAPKRGRFTVPVPPAASKTVKKIVKKCMKDEAEHKYLHAVPASGQTFATSGAVYSSKLSTITQGTTDATRTGNTIRTLRLTARFSFVPVASMSCRVILFVDKQSNGTTPAISAAGGVLNTAVIESAYQSDGVVGWGGKRFVILLDKTFNPPFLQYVAAQGNVQTTLCNKKKVDRELVFSANAGNDADVFSGNIWWLVIGSVASGTFNLYNSWEFIDV